MPTAVRSSKHSLEYETTEGFQETTHTVQNCFIEIAETHGQMEDRICDLFPLSMVLYVTMEPRMERFGGDMSCVRKTLRIGEPHDGLRGDYQGAYDVYSEELWAGEVRDWRKR